jgi:Pvc16 N-terminal domain
LSNHLTIASVSAVLKNLLENGLVSRGISSSIGGDAIVTAVSPDRIAVGNDEKPQLNVFLYQVTPSTGLRSGFERDKPQALSLELHYLFTAYGAQDFQSEILLGYALQMLFEHPVLSSDLIKKALSNVSSSKGGRVVQPTLAALAQSDLADSVAQITLAPQFLNAEETSKLWSSLQARYRPSLTYKLSTVPLRAAVGDAPSKVRERA